MQNMLSDDENNTENFSKETIQKENSTNEENMQAWNNKKREYFADFLLDVFTGPSILIIAFLFDYKDPAMFLLAHVGSAIAIFFFSNLENNQKNFHTLVYVFAGMVAGLLQVDLNFFLQIICAFDPEVCCGEFVPKDSTLRPTCSGSVPPVSFVGGIALLFATSIAILWNFTRWLALVKEYFPAIISLPLVVKIWQLSYVHEWNNIANFSTIFIGILSTLQTLAAIVTFFMFLMHVRNYKGEKMLKSARIMCAIGVVTSYTSAILQTLLLKTNFTSDLFGGETVSPTANLFFTCVTLLAFLVCMYVKTTEVTLNKRAAAKWFADVHSFWSILPLLLVIAFVLFIMALVFLDDSALQNATLLTVLLYTVTLLSQVRTFVYFEDDFVFNGTSLLSYLISDVMFLGIVVSRMTDEYKNAHWCLVAALSFSIIHSVLVGYNVIAFALNKNVTKNDDQSDNNTPNPNSAMWISNSTNKLINGQFKLL